jgi:Flp pilus assembly protein TadD
MRKICLVTLMIAAFVSLAAGSLNASTPERADSQKPPGDTPNYSGPSKRFMEAMAESARRNPDAARLIIEGVDALSRGDSARGEEYFQRVVTMDPKFFGIHLLLGGTYLEEGKIEQGLAELAKEEENHPQNSVIYEASAELLLEMGNKTEALAALRKWEAAEPGNLDAALELAQLLSQNQMYAEAVQVLQQAHLLSPESPRVQCALAEAYFKNRQPEQGRSLLKKGVPASASPEDLGRAAYILADNNVELDLANVYAQRALFQLDAESAAATDEAIGIANTLRLAYLWDVMGWVNFRLGRFQEAVSSLEAAWLLAQRPEAGDHLGQAYEKLGRKEEAAHSYVLAEAAAFGNAQDIRKHYEALMGKKMGDIHSRPAPKAPGSPAKASDASPAEQLSRMRTVNITKSPHPSANAIFSIVFSADKPAEVKYLSGAESLKTLTGQISTAKFNVKFPDSSPVRLFRRGMVVCGSVTGCDVVLLLPGSVHDAD